MFISPVAYALFLSLSFCGGLSIALAISARVIDGNKACADNALNLAEKLDAELAETRHALDQCEADRNALAAERDAATAKLAGHRRDSLRDLTESRREAGRLAGELRRKEHARDGAVTEARRWRDRLHTERICREKVDADAGEYLALAESYAADLDRLRAWLETVSLAFLGRG